MRVFVLCTGRTGSVTFINACKFISNYTCGHESLASEIERRLDYGEFHIEADNRLSWFLGSLDQKFGKDAFYIHLIRDRDATVRSFMNRWSYRGSILDAFTEGILKSPPEKLDLKQKNAAVGLYYDTVNENICHFLKDKPKKMSIELEKLSEEFVKFWEAIGAEGDIKAAIKELSIQHNSSATLNPNYLYKLKLKIVRLLGVLKN